VILLGPSSKRLLRKAHQLKVSPYWERRCGLPANPTMLEAVPGEKRQQQNEFGPVQCLFSGELHIGVITARQEEMREPVELQVAPKPFIPPVVNVRNVVTVVKLQHRSDWILN